MDEKEFDYINVIPLVDVMLVLLTIVLTTSTFIASGAIPLTLPKASSSRVEALKTLVIEIDPQGKVYFNSSVISLSVLQERLQPLQRATPVLIRADRGLQLQEFISVLDVVKSAGFQKVSVQTESKQ